MERPEEGELKMKLSKIILLTLITTLLVACGNGAEKEVSVEDIFKDEIKEVYEIAEKKGTQVLEKIDKKIVSEDLAKAFGENVFNGIKIKYNETLQGIISNTSGDKVGGVKLPVDISFEGTQEEIKLLMNSFEDISSKISIEDLQLEKAGEKFKISCVIEFFGNEKVSDDMSGRTATSAIYMVKGDSKELGDITLRKYDLLMILRPYTSDAASITLEAVGNSDGVLYSDTNKAENIIINFSKNENGYSYKYELNGKSEENKLNIKDDKIIFDILSCSKDESKDKVGVNLHLNNKTDKTVSICIFDDGAQRVKIEEKTENIEVENK